MKNVKLSCSSNKRGLQNDNEDFYFKEVKKEEIKNRPKKFLKSYLSSDNGT